MNAASPRHPFHPFPGLVSFLPYLKGDSPTPQSCLYMCVCACVCVPPPLALTLCPLSLPPSASSPLQQQILFCCVLPLHCILAVRCVGGDGPERQSRVPAAAALVDRHAR